MMSSPESSSASMVIASLSIAQRERHAIGTQFGRIPTEHAKVETKRNQLQRQPRHRAKPRA
jgi:hypothetical protein